MQIQIETKIEELKGLIARGIQAFTEAGKLVVELAESVPMREISEMSGIPMSAIEAMHRVGSNALLPELLLAEYSAARIIQHMPISEQKRATSGPVDVLLETGDTLKIDVRHMTPKQAKQALGRSGIKSLSEQRARMASESKVAATNSNEIKPWAVTGGKVVIYRACEISRRDLATILAEASRS